MKRLTAAALALSLCACSSLIKPSDSQLAALPVVTYPDKPAPNSEYVYKLPAGEPLAMRVISEGSAFSETSEQMTYARLKKDIYLYRRWASDDGKTWHDGHKLIDLHLAISIPSYEAPGPGEMRLKVDRRAAE